MPRPDPSRRAAFEVLKAVRVKDAYTNLVLPHVLGKYRLSGRDAAFTTELAAGTIRRQGTYDAILAACTDRPLASTPAKVLDVLRLGSHQLLSMRVAPHAAISTSVDLVRSEVGPGPAGFANAVLRRVSAHDLEDWLTQLDADRSVRFSHPAWVVEALTEAVGGDEIDALLAADNDPPAVTLVARPGRSTVDELPGEPTAFSPYGVMSSGGSPGDVPAVAEGRAGVQDEGSQLVTHVLATAPIDGADERWLDLCAGPGGKAALLAALAAPRGARLVANERPASSGRARASCAGRRRGRRVGDRRGRHGAALACRARSTACSSTRPAPDSAPSGAGRRRAGGAARRTSASSSRSSVPWSTGLSIWCDPVASCSTRPVRRCSPRPATSSARSWSGVTTRSSATPRPC